MPHLVITEVVLIHYDIGKKIINKIQESCIHLLISNHLVNHQIFHPRVLYL